MPLSKEDEKQLNLYLRAKKLLRSGRIVLFTADNENPGTVTIEIEVSKQGKSIDKIRSEINSEYQR